MVPEARLVQTENGLVPEGDGWFVLNARDARWWHHEKFGSAVTFEGEDARFSQFGINVQVLEPGEPNCMYHGENGQEDFLVLYGECLLLVQGEERPLKQWDFVHSPPWTEHVYKKAGVRSRAAATLWAFEHDLVRTEQDERAHPPRLGRAPSL